MRSDLTLAARPARAIRHDPERDIPRWSALGLFGLWVLVVGPMAALALGLAPILIDRHPEANPGLIFWGTIICGMAWQTVVSVGVLVSEGQSWTSDALRRSLWLAAPRWHRSGRRAWSVLWLAVPLGAFFTLSTDVALEGLTAFLDAHLPAWLTPDYGDVRRLATPENTGNWTIVWLMLISSVFNYILGEAFFFHGILLPRMAVTFGRWGWVVNAVAFGGYHVHKAAMIPVLMLSCLTFSLPSQLTRSIWPALILHGLEGLIGITLLLYVVLGGLS